MSVFGISMASLPSFYITEYLAGQLTVKGKLSFSYKEGTPAVQLGKVKTNGSHSKYGKEV